MTKIEKFAQELARFICHPADGIEIGGASSQLIDIIRTQTKGNDRLRGKVHEWLDFYIEDGSTKISILLISFSIYFLYYIHYLVMVWIICTWENPI